MQIRDDEATELATAFFADLQALAQRLLIHPLDAHHDVPGVLARLVRPGNVAPHRVAASLAPAAYAETGRRLVQTASQLANTCQTVNGFQLTLDWIVSAPQRLLDLLLEAEDDPPMSCHRRPTESV